MIDLHHGGTNAPSTERHTMNEHTDCAYCAEGIADEHTEQPYDPRPETLTADYATECGAAWDTVTA